MAWSYGILILAAGVSSRLGKPKQMLHYNGKTLLQHGLQVAIDSAASPVIAILGANADLLKKDIDNNKITIVINKEWSEGMASSIRCGLEKLLEIAPLVDAVIIMVCDQPHVNVKLLNGLVEKYGETGNPIIASSYENSMGTPALFEKSIFEKLLALKGDTGAKKIMKENAERVSVVNFPLGKIDIDTMEDYESLLSTG